LTCLLFLQNITELGAYFKKQHIKVLTINHKFDISPLFSGIMGTLSDDTLYLMGNASTNKNPNLSRIITGLKNLIKKTKISDDIGFRKIEVITKIDSIPSYAFSNCFIINDDLDITLIKQINQRNIPSVSNSRIISIIQFLIDEEVTPKINVHGYTPIPYFD